MAKTELHLLTKVSSVPLCGLCGRASAFGVGLAIPCGLLPVPWFLICDDLWKSVANSDLGFVSLFNSFP